MGSEVIVIATLSFLMFSAAVLIMMLYTMKKDVENRTIHANHIGMDGGTEKPSQQAE